MSSMPSGMTTGQSPVTVLPAARTGASVNVPARGPVSRPHLGVDDVDDDVQVLDELDELARPFRRWSPVERVRGVDRRCGRRRARLLLHVVAGLPVESVLGTPVLGAPVLGVPARAVASVAVASAGAVAGDGLDQGADGSVSLLPVTRPLTVSAPVEPAVAWCDVCRQEPAVRRVLFTDAVLASVCRGCSAGAVAGLQVAGAVGAGARVAGVSAVGVAA